MNHLDGNALAGAFADTLGIDITVATGRCASCQRVFELASAPSYITAMGKVMRCRHCDSVLAILVSNRQGTLVNLSGLSYLTVPRP